MICDCGRQDVIKWRRPKLCRLCWCELNSSDGSFCGAWFCRGWYIEGNEPAEVDDVNEFDDFTPSQGSHQRDPMRGEVWLHPRNKRDEVRDV